MPAQSNAQRNQQNRALTMGMISDVGGPIASATTFYYNFGDIGSSNSFAPTNSFGPGPDSVGRLVRSWKPAHLIAVGDLAYNVGASTLVDASIGQYYNNFIHPYPSPAYKKDPYLNIGGKAIASGQKQWPYNIYNYPKGFPNPNTGGRGGSSTRTNRFWASLGNHDYGQEVGYGQPGVTPYTYLGKANGTPAGPSSTTSLRSSIDYFIPFLEDPSLLGKDQSRLNVGFVDKTGNSGAYYSIKLGGSTESPLIEVFQLDSERLNVNAGYESWNSADQNGMKREVTTEKGETIYVNEINDDEKNANLQYDPSLPYDPNNPATVPLKGTTKDLDNAYRQYQWLKNSLANSKATWKIITAHHPTYGSGRWSDKQPDSHMSNPYLQRLLKALPQGSFNAVYHGESHYYERILETKTGGIGLGIPFIVNGNAGRNLERKIQIPYGGSIYNPPPGSYRQSNPNTPNPNKTALDANALLDSGPVMAGASGLAGVPSGQPNNFANGLYGYGFGAVKVKATDDFLLFNYQEVPIYDPAIANHLRGGKAPESGFRGTKPSDWIPNQKGTFNVEKDVARFKLSIDNGVVKQVTKIAGGNGYMSSKGGNHVVRGFNIYGNNVDITKPWLKTAQVDLIFKQGELSDVQLTDGGQGYELAVKAAQDNNDATTTATNNDPERDLVIGINYNLDEVQYGVRDTSLYNDWHMTTATQASVKVFGRPGQAGTLEVQMLAKSKQARKLLSGGLKPTTDYSGTGAQSFSSAAQSGGFKLYNKQQLIASGELSNGIWRGYVDKLPSTRERLTYSFDGDAITSYNVNFKASQGTVKATRGRRSASTGANTMLRFSSAPQPSGAGLTASGFNPNDLQTALTSNPLTSNDVPNNPVLTGLSQPF